MPGAPGRSNLQLKYSGWVESNVNAADRPFVAPLGPEVIVVSGATVSTVKERVAGEATTPAGSVARTQKVYAPSASGP